MSTVNIKMSFDIKQIIKWATLILVLSLFIFPFFGAREVEDGKFTKYIIEGADEGAGVSLAWLLIQGKLFVLRGAAWLWILCMLAAPIAMHFTKNMNNMIGWIIRTASAFLAFLGALLLIVAWTETKVPEKNRELFIVGASMLGTWIYMIVSAILCAALAYDGKDYFLKK